MSKQSKYKTNSLYTVVQYIIVVLLLIGIIGLFIRLFVSNNVDTIDGMYIKYGDKIITAENDGITVKNSATETSEFTICNDDGWGVYDVTACSVTIVNNVTSTSDHDFEYTVDGANLPSTFSETTDWTTLFTADGGSVTVDSDGVFNLMFKYETMTEALEDYYGKTVTLGEEILLSGYPYFAIQVVSPDETETITIPFVIPMYLGLSSTSICF